MTGLQTAFDVVGLVFMGVMLLLMMVVIVAVLLIRRKVTHIQQHIEDKLHTARDLAEKGEKVVRTLNKVKRKR